MPEALDAVIRAGLDADPGRRPSLREFADRLRGGFNQSLADDLAGTGTGVGLRLVVSRESGPGRWQPIAATSPAAGRLSRDLRKVPREPERVRVRTGEWVRIEVTADRDGFVTVFNVGPTGNLNLLYPDNDAGAGNTPTVRAGRPLLVTDVVLEPPSGRERVFVVWSREPLRLTDRDLRSLADGSRDAGSRPYRASRDLRRVKTAVSAAGAGNCHVAGLELAHDAPNEQIPITSR